MRFNMNGNELMRIVKKNDALMLAAAMGMPADSSFNDISRVCTFSRLMSRLHEIAEKIDISFNGSDWYVEAEAYGEKWVDKELMVALMFTLISLYKKPDLENLTERVKVISSKMLGEDIPPHLITDTISRVADTGSHLREISDGLIEKELQKNIRRYLRVTAPILRRDPFRAIEGGERFHVAFEVEGLVISVDDNCCGDYTLLIESKEDYMQGEDLYD